MAISQQDLMNLYKSGNISSDTFNKLSPPLKMADGGMVASLQSGHPLDVIRVDPANPKFKKPNDNSGNYARTSDAGEAVGLARGTPVNASENDTINGASNTAADGALVGSEGDIPLDQSMAYPTTSDVNMATGTPQGQMVLAQNSAPALPGNAPSEQSFAGGVDPLNSIKLTRDVTNDVNNSGQFNRYQGYSLNLFPDDITKNQEKTTVTSGKEAKKGIEEIAKKTKEIAAPVSDENLKMIQEVNAANKAYYADLALNTQKAKDAQAAAKDQLNKLANNAVIDPEKYMKELGTSGKVMTGIGLVLSGIGSGITGQSNMAMQVLQNNINRDIDAQKQTIKNQFEKVASQLNISKSVLDTANMDSAIRHLATITTITGAKAANEAASQHVSNATAQEKGKILSNQLDMTLMNAFNGIDSLHMGMAQAGQQDSFKLLTGGIMNFAEHGTFSRPDLINTNNFVTQKNKQPRYNLGVNKPQIEQYQPAQPAEKPGFLDSFLSKMPKPDWAKDKK